MRSVLQTQGESRPRSCRRLMDVMLAAGVVPGKPIICRYIYGTVSAIGSANRPGLAPHPNAEEDQQMRIAVLGSGGIGGSYGALLAKAGDAASFAARGAPREGMQRRGLTVRPPDGESTIRVTAVADTASVGPVDLVLFCVKSYDTEPAAQALKPLMATDTAVVTLQNGVDNVAAIAGVVGTRAVLAGAVYAALQLAGPGVVARTGGEGKIVFGEPGGTLTDRVQRIASAFQASSIPPEGSTDIQRRLWTKFLFIAGVGGG